MFEPGGRFTGRWYRAAGTFTSPAETKITWTQDEIPNGISHSAGNLTVLQPGRWRLIANVMGPSASATFSARIGTSTDTWSAFKGPTAIADLRFSLCTELALPTGQVFSVYYTSSVTTAPTTGSPVTAQSFNFTATYTGPM